MTKHPYLTKIPTDGGDSLAIGRIKMRRRIVAALLRHGADGVWGWCYCGYGYDNSTFQGPRSLSAHIAEMVAAETGLDVEYVTAVQQSHGAAIGYFGGEMRCGCGVTYDDSFDSYGAERHRAEALAANASWDDLRAAEARRRVAA